MSIAPLIPLAYQAGAMALEAAGEIASSASDFAQLLVEKSSASSEEDPAVATSQALESFRQLLLAKLPSDVSTQFTMRVRQSATGELGLAGVHVDEQRINEVIAVDDELREAFELLAARLRGSDGSPDPGQLELRVDHNSITHRFT
ncbi:MAG: hypothetical protein QGG36_16185 [Pirellulaceae bacterium]|jgi:hypothetical protein|nr:hypothetical protein [Pirellulaceae bacterium]MDP7017344.1 hypothetical protein [Pirellulaceae bacterium]